MPVFSILTDLAVLCVLTIFPVLCVLIDLAVLCVLAKVPISLLTDIFLFLYLLFVCISYLFVCLLIYPSIYLFTISFNNHLFISFSSHLSVFLLLFLVCIFVPSLFLPSFFLSFLISLSRSDLAVTERYRTQKSFTPAKLHWLTRTSQIPSREQPLLS